MRFFLSILSMLFSFSVVEAQNLGTQDVENVAKTVEQSLAQGVLKDIKEAIESKSADTEKIIAIEESLRTLKMPLVDFPLTDVRKECQINGQIVSHNSLGPLVCFRGEWRSLTTSSFD